MGRVKTAAQYGSSRRGGRRFSHLPAHLPLPQHLIGGFLAFGLMALLYLVTEELLVEAHEKPDSPAISALFFVGFLGLLLVEEMLA